AAPAPGRPAEPAPRDAPAEAPFGGRAFSLLRPKIELPPLPGPRRPGGSAAEGEGTGREPGSAREGQEAIPLNTPDPRYADYFPEIKKRIQDHWVYPTEAARKHQSGQLVLEFVIRKDGRVPVVDVVRSSGFEILDRYALTAVRLAAPFPAIPADFRTEEIRISASFTYILDHGFQIFGLR
ncbi:MAG: energy transducer TonB, partial [Candidatus Rokuibacteriota bacterium]